MGGPFDQMHYMPLDTFAFEALAVSTASVPFTAATRLNAKLATVSVEGAAVRYRMDGTDPTASVGTVLEPGDELIVWGGRDIQSIEFIRRDGTDATLNVHYAR